MMGGNSTHEPPEVGDARYNNVAVETHFDDGTMQCQSLPSWSMASGEVKRIIREGDTVVRGKKVYHYPPHRISLVVFFDRDEVDEGAQ